MKRNVIVIIGVLILFTKCIFIAATPGIPAERFRTTVATIVKRDLPVKGKAYPIFEYYVGNKKYEGIWIEYMYWAVIGEKYLLTYDLLYPENQKNVELITDYPVFLPGEVTNYTVGKVINIYDWGSALIEFEYTVLGKKYERPQFIERSHLSKKHLQMIKGAEFIVEYLVENPERVILYIDKPVNGGVPIFSPPNTDVLRPVWDSIPVLLSDPEMIKFQPGW